MTPILTACGSARPSRAARRQFHVDEGAGAFELGDLGDHRKFDEQRPAAGRTDQRPQLLPQHGRAVEPDADRPPAHRRVVLGGMRQIGQHLVAADIERPEEHRAMLGLLEDALVVFGQILDVRETCPAPSAETRCETARPPRRRSSASCARSSSSPALIISLISIPSRVTGGTERKRLVIGAAPAPRLDRGGHGLLDVGARPDQHIGVIAVDDDDVARLDPARRVVDPPDDRDVEGARHNRDMGGRRAFLEHQTQ